MDKTRDFQVQVEHGEYIGTVKAKTSLELTLKIREACEKHYKSTVFIHPMKIENYIHGHDDAIIVYVFPTFTPTHLLNFDDAEEISVYVCEVDEY